MDEFNSLNTPGYVKEFVNRSNVYIARDDKRNFYVYISNDKKDEVYCLMSDKTSNKVKLINEDRLDVYNFIGESIDNMVAFNLDMFIYMLDDNEKVKLINSDLRDEEIEFKILYKLQKELEKLIRNNEVRSSCR